MNAPTVHLGRFRYEYEGGVVFEVNVERDDALHWRCVAGENLGQEGRENVDRVPLHANQHLLSWSETDGLVVAQVVDYAAGSVNTVLVLPGGKRVMLQGTVKKS
jgi:phenolic acid decarboxylase